MSARETFIEAAVNGKDGSNVAYFFLWDHFVAYNWISNRVLDGVKPISAWKFPLAFASPGVGTRLDAALKGRDLYNNKAYFFRGAEYTRYNLDSETMETDPPVSLLQWHFSSPFLEGIEASYNGRFSREGKAYFFKGSQYIRYDWKGDAVDAGYPHEIRTIIGMPPEFGSSIDAAVDGDGAFQQFSYLFKEDRFLALDWNPTGGEPHVDSSSISPTIPSIHIRWPGLAELLLAGKAKAQGLLWVDAAKQRLRIFNGLLNLGFGDPLVDAALSTHFHIASTMANSDKMLLVNQIIDSYDKIVETLNKSQDIFRYRTDAEALGDGLDPTVPVAAAYVDPATHTINFTQRFVNRGPMNRAASIVHESVHIFDPDSGSRNTHIPEWYVTDAEASALGLSPQPENTTDFATRYNLMTTADSLHNPSSFAALAQHLFYGRDERFGEGHHDM